MLANKFFLLLLFFALFTSISAKALEGEVVKKSIAVMVKKTDAAVASDLKIDTESSLLLNGMRQALTSELTGQSMDSELFWKKIEEKNLGDSDEVTFLKPLFSEAKIELTPPIETDQFLRGTLTYDVSAAKVKTFFEEVMSGIPDPAVKTFYILPDIAISSDMTWNDVGVTKKENFSGVIIDSWKTWATTHFKNFTNVVILEKDFSKKPDNIHAESVTLKWNSNLKKGESFQDRKTTRFELNAQYVLVSTKTNQNLVAFDFPLQKRELNILNPKDLSSNLASLIYNLLNSQMAKITTVIELNQAASAMSIVEVNITGKHGLFDITQINNFLSEHFKAQDLAASLKSYSSGSSVISIKSTLNAEALYALFAKDGGKYPLNEQKILLFSPDTKTFAIILK